MDALLDLHVHRRRGVVEQEDVRIGQDRPGQRDSLPLAPGERDPLLTDHRLVALGELVDELVCRGRTCGRPHILIGGVGPAVGDVGADGVGEQETVLEHHTDPVPQLGQRPAADVDAIHGDGAGVGVEEPGQHGERGGLAAAGRPDQSHGLAGLDLEREPAEHLVAVAVGVGEPDVAEGDAAPMRLHVDRTQRLGDLRTQVQQLTDPLRRRAGHRGVGQHHAGDPGHTHQFGEVSRAGEEDADGEVTVQHKQAAHQQHQDLAGQRRTLQGRHERRPQPHGSDPGAEHVQQGTVQSVRLGRLLSECADHADAGDGLLHPGGHLRLALLRIPSGRVDLAALAVGDREHGDDHRDDERGHRWRQREHDDDRERGREQGTGHVRDPGQQHVHEVQVATDPGDQLTALQLRMAGEVQPLQCVVDVVAQVVLDAERRLAADVAPAAGQQETGDGDAREQREQRRERYRAGDDGVVDHPALGDRNGRHRPRPQQRQQD